jgi:hypothetical protein
MRSIDERLEYTFLVIEQGAIPSLFCLKSYEHLPNEMHDVNEFKAWVE